MWFSLTRPSYQTLNQITVSRPALIHNFLALQQAHPEAQICPVLKSNAYGHGLEIVGRALDKVKAPFLVVDSLYEAYELQRCQVKTPILIMGYTQPNNFKVKRLPFHYAVYDLEIARALSQYQPGAKVHIFVDTGMHREGVPLAELDTFITELKTLNLEIEGLTSHFADADNPKNQKLSQLQISSFNQALYIMTDHEIAPKWKHISASAGSYKYFNDTFNMLRVGLASYGISPLETSDKFYTQIKLQPVLNFYSTLVQIKSLSKGDSVGYNATFTAKKDMTLGLIPAGYYEGVDRRLSNQGIVTINSQECPIVGRVSMNMTCIDLTQATDAKVGDQVCIYSANPNDNNSLVAAAKTAGTIPYELMVHLAESVKREIV